MDSGSLESRFSSIVPKVEFVNVKDQYACNEDLICRYCVIDYEVQEGDRIALFKLGWQFVKDYVLFEWVPKDPEENSVLFNKHCIPKNTIEIYQFCYISGENNVHGASEPFQFFDRSKNYQSLFTSYKKDVSLPDYKSLTTSTPSLSITSNIDKDKELLKLKEENEFLHKALKIMVTKNNYKSYDADIHSLKKLTYELQSAFAIQQLQIKELQKKVMNSEYGYKKLFQERAQLENTCKTLLSQFDKNGVLKSEIDLQFGELESIPPIPFTK